MSTSQPKSEQKTNTTTIQAETPWQPSGKLTRKQNAFVQALVQDKRISATQAYKQAYGAVTDGTARVESSRTLAKPNIQAELSKYEASAEDTIVDVMDYSRKQMRLDDRNGVQWAVNARQTADSLLDRTRGKATQRTEVTTTGISLNIDLTSSLPDTTT